MITFHELNIVMPRAHPKHLKPLNKAMAECYIDTPRRAAAFLAQIAHESAELTRLVENMSYSVEGILRTWPRRFTSETAAKYAHNPAALGNFVYANRMGNGNEESGDGYRYRGRGPLQISGRDVYHACGVAIGLDLIGNPDLAAMPEYTHETAGWFWLSHSLNELADKNNFDAISKAINLGDPNSSKKPNGMLDRVAYWTRAQTVLGVA